MNDKLLTTAEAAEKLSLKESTLRVWRCTGERNIKYMKIGGAVRYKESDLNKYIESCTYNSHPPHLSVNIPNAFSELPDRTIITRGELASIIGKSTRSISGLIVEGAIPRAINEKRAPRPSGLVWSLGSIRQLKVRNESE